MSGHLSQEEIDKMMQESNENNSSVEVEESQEVEEVTDNTENPYESMDRPVLTDFEIDGLGEIGNISMGTASTTLNILLNQEVSITTPEVTVVDWEEAVNPSDQDFIIIEVNYTEGFEGSSVLLIKKDDAKIIADLMMGGDGTNVDDELNDFHLSAISEAMNQMVGTSATSMSKIFDITVDIAPPKVIIEKPKDYNYKEIFENSPTPYFVKTSFRIVIGDLIDSRIMQLLGLPFALDMFNTLINNDEDSQTSEEVVDEKELDKSPVEKPVSENEVEEEQSIETEKTDEDEEI